MACQKGKEHSGQIMDGPAGQFPLFGVCVWQLMTEAPENSNRKIHFEQYGSRYQSVNDPNRSMLGQ